VQLEIADSMEQADDPSDALHLYKKILHHHPSLREALEGAGRTAFQMGRYLEAKHYLGHALEGPGIDKEPGAAAVAQSRENLTEATRLLLVYPSSRLPQKEQYTRILADRKLAMDRLAQCTQTKASAPAPATAKEVTPPSTDSASKPASNALQSLASHFSRKPAQPAEKPVEAPPAVDPLQALAARWQQLPAKMSVDDLNADPDLAQTQIQLIYDTELTTQQVCGAPTGDDALLLKIAQGPNQVEEE
jgi:tetratricopeptide (TPR) repeat protein